MNEGEFNFIMSFDRVSINFLGFYFINKPVNKVQFKTVKENKLQDFFHRYIIWFYPKQTPQGKWEMFALFVSIRKHKGHLAQFLTLSSGIVMSCVIQNLHRLFIC